MLEKFTNLLKFENSFFQKILFLSAILSPFSAHAQSINQNVTIEGRAFYNKVAIDGEVDIKFEVYFVNAGTDCVLYTDEHVQVPVGSSDPSSVGFFNLQLGTGATTIWDVSKKLSDVFSNGEDITVGSCGTVPKATLAGKSRLLRISIREHGSGQPYSVLSAATELTSVPTAMIAETVQGLGPVNFFQTSAGATQAKLDDLLITRYTTLSDILSGTSSLYLKNGATGTVLPARPSDPGSPVAGQLWYDSTTNQIKYYNGSAVATVDTGGSGVTSVTAGTGLNGGTITSSGTISIATGGVTNGMLATGIDAAKITTGTLPAGVVPSGTDSTKLPLAGGTMTGGITMGAATDFAGFNLLNTGHVTMNAQRTFTIGRYDATQQTALISSLNAANAGAVWFNSATGKLMYWNGTAAFEVSETTSAGGDITAVNTNAGSGLTGGATSGAVSLSVNVDGSTVEISSNALRVKDSGITSAKISDGTIATIDIANSAVTNVKIDTVNVAKITSGPSDYFSYMPAGGECTGGGILVWNDADNRWICGMLPAVITAHSGLSGLTAGDDHTQYVMLAGRTGGQVVRGGTAANNNLTLESTSNAAKGDVIIQPNGGDTAFGGYVGLGTTTPSNRLVVGDNSLGVLANPDSSIAVGSATTSSVISFGQSATARGAVAWSYNATPANAFMSVTTVSTDNPVVLQHAGGNVGIGITAPEHPLDVNGQIRGSGMLVNYGNSTAYAASGGTASLGGPGGLTINNYNGANNSIAPVRFAVENSTGSPQAAYITAVANAGVNTPSIAFGQQSGAATYAERMRIDAEGQVGIGTTNAQSTLHVAGVIRAQQICNETGGNCRNLTSTGETSGTVTSASLTMPGIFSVGGSPIVSSGTFNVTLATQTANTVFAGPTSAGAAAPTFRSLVAADIPSLDTGKITSGTFAAARLPQFTGGDVTTSAAGSTALTLGIGVVGTTALAGDSVTGSKIDDGTITAADFASSVANGLWTVTGSDVYRNSGDVGIGTTDPSTKLHVAGQILSESHKVTSGGAVNFANGNHQILESVGGSSLSITGTVSGGSYTILITDTTARTYTITGAGCAAVRAKNGSPVATASTHTIITIMMYKVGSTNTCYVAWSSGW